MFEISVIDTARYVFSSKDGTIESLDGRVELSARLDKIWESLEDDKIGGDMFSNLLDSSLVSDKLLWRWHVNTVYVGVASDQRT